MENHELNYSVQIISSIEEYNLHLSEIINQLLYLGNYFKNDFYTNLPHIGVDGEGSPDLSKLKGTLCILQLSIPNRYKLIYNKILNNYELNQEYNDDGITIYLIDVFTIGGIELMKSTNLKNLLESNNIVKIIHDCRRDNDVLFYQCFNTKLNCIYDTQIANNCIKKFLFLNTLQKVLNEKSYLYQFCKEYFLNIYGYLDHLVYNYDTNNYNTIINFIFDEIKNILQKVFKHNLSFSRNKKKINIKSDIELNIKEIILIILNFINLQSHYLKTKNLNDIQILSIICKDIYLHFKQINILNVELNLTKDEVNKFTDYFSEEFKNQLNILLFNNFKIYNLNNNKRLFTKNNINENNLIEKEMKNKLFEKFNVLNFIFISQLIYFDLINKKDLKELIILPLFENLNELNELKLNYLFNILLIKYNQTLTFSKDNLFKLLEMSAINNSINQNVNLEIFHLNLTKINNKWTLQLYKPLLSNNDIIIDNTNELLEINNYETIISHTLIRSLFRIKGLVSCLHEYCSIDYSLKYNRQIDFNQQEYYWKERPLTSEKIEGASMDVLHLLYLYESQQLFINLFLNNNLNNLIIERSQLYSKTLRDFEYPFIRQEILNILNDFGKEKNGYFYLDLRDDNLLHVNEFKDKQYLRIYFFNQQQPFNTTIEESKNNLISNNSEVFNVKIPLSTIPLGKVIGSKGKTITEIITKFPTCEMFVQQESTHGAFIVIGTLKEIEEIHTNLYREIKFNVNIDKNLVNQTFTINFIKTMKRESGCELFRISEEDSSDKYVNILLGGNEQQLDRAKRMISIRKEKKRK
ncbi:hypothetical protein ABK040_000144 [Willaertia magna]